MERIFIVEDDEDIALVVSETLRADGYATSVFGRAMDFYRAVEDQKPDLVLIDVMLPDFDGFRIGRFLRSRPDLREIPIIFITAKVSEKDKLTGFEVGADDYITKPFSLKELVARVKAVLRRAGKMRSEGVLTFGDLEIDTKRVRVTLKGNEIKLTPSEFKILKLLAENHGIPLGRDKIIEEVWGLDRDATDRTVDVHIKHLRDKLRGYGSLIKTVRGFGYKFEVG